MITGWILQALAWVWNNLLEHLPMPDPPAWFDTAGAAVQSAIGHMAGLGAWFPFTILGLVLGSWLTILAVSLTVKVVRIAASFFTLGGGAAG